MAMIIEILEQNSNCIKNFNVLRDLTTMKEILDILNSHNIKSNLLDMLKIDLLIRRQGVNFFKSSYFELLSSCVTKMIRERKADTYTKLLDQNLGIVNVFEVRC
jgi:cell division FtsZ-interacting protein ZapD